MPPEPASFDSASAEPLSHVVMTGASGGIGAPVARLLRQGGAHVTAIGRHPCADCDDTIIADLADPAALDQVAATLATRPVTTLINNAGFQYFGPMERQDPANIRAGYGVNVIAPAVLIRSVLPQMQARRQGHIVNIGSVLGSINYPCFATYSSSKAALHGLSEGLRRECTGTGIDVTHISPRAVRTGFNSPLVQQFLKLAGMTEDEPEPVARRIVDAILKRRRDVVIGGKERFFIGLNAVAPALVDRGLGGQARQARALFQS